MFIVKHPTSLNSLLWTFPLVNTIGLWLIWLIYIGLFLASEVKLFYMTFTQPLEKPIRFLFCCPVFANQISEIIVRWHWSPLLLFHYFELLGCCTGVIAVMPARAVCQRRCCLGEREGRGGLGSKGTTPLVSPELQGREGVQIDWASRLGRAGVRPFETECFSFLFSCKKRRSSSKSLAVCLCLNRKKHFG